MHFAGNLMGAFDEGQLLDAAHLLRRGHDGNGIEPTGGAHLLGSDGVDLRHVAAVERVVADVVEVGTALVVALNGFGVEIGVGVEGGALFVGEEHPVARLAEGRKDGQDSDDGDNKFLHGLNGIR